MRLWIKTGLWYLPAKMDISGFINSVARKIARPRPGSGLIQWQCGGEGAVVRKNFAPISR
jgi:hypothetical protein